MTPRRAAHLLLAAHVAVFAAACGTTYVLGVRRWERKNR